MDRVVCCALVVASVVGFLFGSGLPKTIGSAALVSSGFQLDVTGLNLQTVAQAKERGRQISPVQQAIDGLTSMSNDLARHMDHQVQKRAKLHRQES